MQKKWKQLALLSTFSLVTAVLVVALPEKEKEHWLNTNQAVNTTVTATPLPSVVVTSTTLPTTTVPPTTLTMAPTTTQLSSTTTTKAPPRTSTTAATRSAPRKTGVEILERIKQCESEGDYTAVNGQGSTASGAYQFLDSTWDNYGGHSRAKFAPPSVQDERAVIEFNRNGTRPWYASRSCWG